MQRDDFAFFWKKWLNQTGTFSFYKLLPDTAGTFFFSVSRNVLKFPEEPSNIHRGELKCLTLAI